MATALIRKRRAFYALTESSSGTYEAPVQSGGTPSVPIHIMDAVWSIRGGVQPQTEDVSPYAASIEPIQGPIGWEVQTTVRLPAHPNPTDDAAIDLYPLLRSCPGTISDNTGAGPTTFNPTTAFVDGTDFAPASFTDIQSGGNVYSGQAGVGILESIASDDGVYHTMTFRHHLQCRDTLATSVQDAAAAGLTSDAAWDDYVTQSYVPAKSGTLVITNLLGTATLELYNYSLSLGLDLQETVDQLEANGYGCSVARYTGHPVLTATIPAYREVATADGRQPWGAYFAQTDLGGVGLLFGTGSGTFTIELQAAEIISMTPTEYNGREAYTIEFAGITQTGDDAFTLTWGT